MKLTRSFARAVVVATMLLALSAAGASAHTQTVTPNGNGDGFTKAISNPWAMAHCQAAAPFVTAPSSGGVVQFNPPLQFTNCIPGTRGQ
jgi:hypothetical protein